MNMNYCEETVIVFLNFVFKQFFMFKGTKCSSLQPVLHIETLGKF